MSCAGEVKSFNDGKGWGFITYEGTDVFVHVKDCTDGRPQPGDAVYFNLEEDKIRAGQMKALNVTGCTGVADGSGAGFKGAGGGKALGKGKGCSGGVAAAAGSGTCEGTVKSFNDGKGWGFITYEGTDIFVHVKDCNGGVPQSGDWLSFDVEEDPVRGGGQLKAINVAGGTGVAKGKGKGKDMGGYGPMWGGCAGMGAWGADPWGCGGGPYGKGFGGCFGAWDGGMKGAWGQGKGAW